MEEKFVKAARILERLSEETFGPNDNWSIPGMQLHRAKNGNEDAKTSICLMVGASVGLSAKDVERVFDSLYGGTNENKQHKTRYNMKKTIRLSESDLHRVIEESVKKVFMESIDSVSPDPFGTFADSYHSQSKEDAMFLNKNCPWRKNPDCDTVEGLIEWGNNCSRDFESGKLSIRNYLGDLNRMANGGI
jgi:hypothetical protein